MILIKPNTINGHMDVFNGNAKLYSINSNGEIVMPGSLITDKIKIKSSNGVDSYELNAVQLKCLKKQID